MDSSTIVIDHLLRKYKADQKWTRIVIEQLKANPEKLLEQPYLNFPTFSSAGLDNQSTVLEMLLHQFRHLPSHTGQIIYIAKMRKGQLVWG